MEYFEVGDKVTPGRKVFESCSARYDYTPGKVYEVESSDYHCPLVFSDDRSTTWCAEKNNGWFELVQSVSKKRKGMR